MTMEKKLSQLLNKPIYDCTDLELYDALLQIVQEMAKEKEAEEGKKKIYYISAEFLIGKLLSNNMINLGIYDEVKELLAKNGKDLCRIEELEQEPSLGNGGLGRLAACFLDSIATLGYTGAGIGLNYHLGLFKQEFDEKLQKETKNPWIAEKSWLTKTDITYPVNFKDFTLQARMYEIAVTGYNNRTNKLHLFDVDTVKNITNHISRISGKTYGESYKTDVSLRVITDHIRSTVMMICDGVIPSNEGRGYVLRRLLRRAARHGKLLGIDKPFLYQVCDTVIQESGGAYPALVEKQGYIRKVIQVEEERFDATVDAGLAILNDMIEAAKKAGSKELPAADAFKLHDTYGFPIDLTIEILEEQGMRTDREGFDALIQEQKERSREDRKRMGDVGWASEDLGLDKSLKTEFCGYTDLEATGNVLALIAEGESTDAVRAGSKVTVVLDKTPFYAEMGGQVPDYGTISHGDCEIEINNVQKNGDGRIYLHSGVVKSGVISRGDTVTCKVDKERRQAICRSHTATHLLQQALREVLGSHVEQAGSYTDADHVRFDFTHFAAMTPEEIAKVEALVNNAILEGMNVRTDEMPIEEAKKLGAMALFGEKYGDVVRVVRAGDYSIEFCGGTHLDNTAKAGMFKIVSEASVAAGVRRIEALTGRAFLEMVEKREETLNEIASELKATPNCQPCRSDGRRNA